MSALPETSDATFRTDVGAGAAVVDFWGEG